jgi:predicted MFS family arabinose efflux permease
MKSIFSFFLKHYRGFSFSLWFHLIAVLINSGVSVVTIFLVLYLTNQLRFSPMAAGWVVTTFGIGSLIGAFSSGFLCDRFNSQLISIVSLFINAFLLLILPFVYSLHYLLLLALILGASNYAFSPANRVTMMNLTRQQDHVRVSAIRYMMMNLGFGAYVFIAGRLVVYSYNWLFILSGISVLCISCMMLLSYLKTSPHLKINRIESVPKEYSSEKSLLLQFVWLYLGLFLRNLELLILFICINIII